MSRLGAPLDLVGAFWRVVEDEIRHVDVCAEMVERFGGSPTFRPRPFATAAYRARALWRRTPPLGSRRNLSGRSLPRCIWI